MKPRTSPLPTEPAPAPVPPLDDGEPAGPVEETKTVVPPGETFAHHGYARWPGSRRWHEFPKIGP